MGDLRRSVRSNTKRLKVHFKTAEAMLNHLRSRMERIYDEYEYEDARRRPGRRMSAALRRRAEARLPGRQSESKHGA